MQTVMSPPVYAAIMNGEVLAVNRQYNFVIIDLGKNNNVKNGMEFMVYRGKRLLGKVRTRDVFKDMSLCVVLPWWKPVDIKAGDGVLKP